MWVFDVFRSVSKAVALLFGHRPKKGPRSSRSSSCNFYKDNANQDQHRLDFTNYPIYAKILFTHASNAKPLYLFPTWSKKPLIEAKKIPQEENEGFKAICKVYSVSPILRGVQIKYYRLNKGLSQPIACFSLVKNIQLRLCVKNLLDDIESIFSEEMSGSERGFFKSVETTHSSIVYDFSDNDEDLRFIECKE